MAAQTGLAVQDTIPQLGIAVVEAPEAGTSAELAATAAALEASPAVEWAEPNYTFTLDATPNDPYYATQAPYLNRLEMPAAWDYTTGQSDVIIAVLDTGVDTEPPGSGVGHLDQSAGRSRTTASTTMATASSMMSTAGTLPDGNNHI